MLHELQLMKINDCEDDSKEKKSLKILLQSDKYLNIFIYTFLFPNTLTYILAFYYQLITYNTY